MEDFTLFDENNNNITIDGYITEELADEHLGTIECDKWESNYSSARIEKSFDIIGTKKDRLTIALFYKNNGSNDIRIELLNNDNLVYTQNKTLYTKNNVFNCNVIYIDPNKSYNKVKITIFLDEQDSFYIAGLNIFNGINGVTNKLDNYTQLIIENLSNEGLTEYKYDENNFLTETITNGNHTIIERNDKEIPIKIYNDFLINEKTYNSLNKCINNKIKSTLRNTYQEEVNNYNYYTNELKDEYLQNSVDINRNNTTYYWRTPHKLLLAYEKSNYYKNYKYDILDRKTQIIYDNISNVDYDEIFDESENNSFSSLYNTINYDDYKRVSNYSARGISADFNFNDSENELDKAQNLTKVELNNNTLEEYEYGLSTNNSSQYFDLLKSKKYSNGHKIIYTYDENDNISKITLQNENAVNTVLGEIVYDNDNHNLVKSITDEYNNTTTFEYDNNEYVCKKSDSRGVIEESEINDNYLLNTVKDEKNITTYFSINDFSSKTRKCFIENIQDINSHLYSCFFEENINMISKTGNIVPSSTASFNLTRVNNVSCVINQNGLNYKLYHPTTNDNTTKISLAFWFFPVSNPQSNQALINVGTEDENKCYLYIDPNGYVILQNENILEYSLNTTNKINLNTWNFIGLTLSDSNDILKAKIYLNEQISEKSFAITNFLECNQGKFVFNIGNKLDNNLINFTTGITSVIIDTENEFSKNEMIALYLKSKDYIIDYYNNNLLNKHIYHSGINYYKSCDFINSHNFDMIPLNNTFTSYNKIKPIYIENIHSIKCDNNQYFVIDKDLNRPVYQAFGNDLKYDLNTTNKFSALLKMKVNYFNDKNYILQLNNELNNIGLYINKQRKLCIIINSSTIQTNLIINLNTWHTVLFSWNFDEEANEHSFRLVLDSTSYEHTHSLHINCDNMILNIGCGKYYDYNYPLFGLIEQFIYVNEYPNQDILDTCKACMNINTYYNTYDEFKHLVKKNNTEYQYKVVSNTFLTNLISREVTNINNLFCEQRDYLYDNKDNVTSVKVNNEEYRSYEFNHFNFLTKEELKNLSKTIEYNYNYVGNISSKKIITGTTEKLINYVYDNNNLLTSYDGLPITYNNGFINTAYLNGSLFTFGWKGKSLDSLTLDNTINLEFKYTFDGKRIKKIINIDNDSIEYIYYYSGDNLIREEVNNNVKGENYVVKYIYDENNILIGLDYNNKLYYYIRDILGNIHKIVDESGNIVTTYEYDAYGNVLSKYGTLANINSFIYKGYYYDAETGLFYCNSRYYNPEWCRWISPDDVEYLDPESVNGLNLYCYCKNNPVM